jgi:hypothetical protein
MNMISRPPTPKIITLGTLMHMEPCTHDAYTEEYIVDEDLRRYFSIYKAKFVKKKVLSRLATISRMGFSTSWIRFVFLKETIYNLLERHTPPKLEVIYVWGK